MTLSCCGKFISITYRNNIRSCWRLLLFKLFSFIQHKRKTQKHEKVCNDHDYCYVEMSDKDSKILKYNHGEKSLKALFMIYVDLECLLEKCIQVKIILKKLIQRKKLSIRLPAIHCLQIVHLIQRSTQQKISLIATETKIVWKSFVKT